MTSPPSTISRSFPGVLALADGEVPAVVGFSNGSVSLVVAGDTIGTWPRTDIELRPVANGYELVAEGDVLSFLPEEREALAGFLTGEAEAPNETDDVASDAVVEEPAAHIAPEASPPETVPETPTLFDGDFGGEITSTPSEILPSLNGGLPEDSDAGGPVLFVEEEPDEFFAAGLNGPNESAPPPFRPLSPLRPRPDDAEAPPGVPEAADLPIETVSEPPLAETEPSAPAESPPVPVPDVEPAPVEEPATPAEDVVDEPTPTAAPRRGLLARITAEPAATSEATTADQGESEEDDDLPDPMSDAENLRQWGLVIAGAFVVVIVLAVATWGLVTMLGSDGEATDDPAAETPSTVSLPPPTTPTSTPPVPSTTVPVENREAAVAFVSSWNGLADQYAPHLTISGDSLPLAAAPASTVHLVYDEAGTLTMTMAPRGDRADRDILVAMGLAVAWADPTLGPEARRDLLASLGVDVDEPETAVMGGELGRNGATYALSVADGILNFEVTPPA